MQCAQEPGGVEGGDDSTNACAHICGVYRCAEVWAVPSALNRCLLTLSCDGSLRVRTAGAIGAYCFKNHQVSASRVSLSACHMWLDTPRPSRLMYVEPRIQSVA